MSGSAMSGIRDRGRVTPGPAGLERAMRAHPAGRALPAGRSNPVPELDGARTRVRLTARGRRLVAALGLALGVGVAAVVGQAGSTAEGLHMEGQSSVVVRPGDTLWSIASSVAGSDDVRDVVDRIERINGLRGSALASGQVLRLP